MKWSGRYLADQFAALLADEDFLDALPGHLPGDPASQERIPLIREKMERIISAAIEER